MRLVGSLVALMFLGWLINNVVRSAARDVLRERDDRYAVDDRELERNIRRGRGE
jgi:hypothetical protein